MKKTCTLFLLLWISHLSFAQSNDFIYYKSLGMVQYYEKDFLQGVFNLQKAATIKPDDKEVTKYLKMCYDSIGNKDLSGKMRMKMEKFGSGTETRPVINSPSLSDDYQPANAQGKRSNIPRPITGASADAAHDLKQLGDFFMDRESYDSAVICYQHYIDMYPRDTAMRFYLATSEYFTKQYDAAISNFQVALQKEPKRAELYNWIGVCELLRGNYLAARDNFKQCIKMDPDYSLAYFNIGKTQYELEDYGDAEKNLEKAQEFMPNDNDILKMLADIDYNTGKWDKARVKYEQLYNNNKKNDRSIYRLGDLSLRMGQWDKAILYLGKYLESAPTNAEVRKKIGVAYYNTEKYVSALDNFDRASKTLWDDKELMLYAAISANKLGDYQKALDYANRAITLDKNYVRAYYQLATAYKGVGEKKDAKEALEKARDIEMNSVGTDAK